jgi:hypothetical protein
MVDEVGDHEILAKKFGISTSEPRDQMMFLKTKIMWK